MKLTFICTCVLFVLACNLAVSTAYPTTYYNDEDFRDFDGTYNFRDSRLRRIDYSDSDDQYNYRNSRRRRINDYDDDDLVYYKYDTRKAATRREGSETYKYTPLIRYKSTRTQRKKLFVPNLFG